MRCWYPIPVSYLDNEGLLGEHKEIPIMIKSLSGIIRGWRNHPETRRWEGHTKALKTRHDQIAEEMILRGMNHKTPIPDEWIIQSDSNSFTIKLVEPVEAMYKKIDAKIEYRKTKRIFRFFNKQIALYTST